MFTLTYPSTGSPVAEVELPNPQYGNTQRVRAGIITRETRHGVPVGSRDSNYPVVRNNLYNFTTITKTKADELKAFLLLYAGYKLKIVDHNSVTFYGYLASSSVEFVTLKNTCSYDFSLEIMRQPA